MFTVTRLLVSIKHVVPMSLLVVIFSIGTCSWPCMGRASPHMIVVTAIGYVSCLDVLVSLTCLFHTLSVHTGAMGPLYI